MFSLRGPTSKMRSSTTSREAYVNVSGPLYEEAVGLLRALSGPHGIRASLSSSANYSAVFARDAVMAGVAGLLIEERAVTDGLIRSLEHLRDLQGAQGQIASNYLVSGAESPRTSFGSLVPRLDAPLWYMIGVALGARASVLDAEDFRESVGFVVRLLDTLEYNGRHLVYVPVGGDWADEYIYQGYVLHDQVLRAWALRLAGSVYGERAWVAKAADIERTIGASYWTREAAQRGYPLSAFTPARVYDMFDLATCSLLAVSGASPDIGASALDWIGERFLARAELPPAFDPVIDEGHRDWPELSRYHLHGFRNRPHEYHNGGVWMIWLGWLALALARAHRERDLGHLRDAISARLASVGTYGFEEYFHGRTGQPAGTPQMAYSATGVVFLEVASTPARLRLLEP